MISPRWFGLLLSLVGWWPLTSSSNMELGPVISWIKLLIKAVEGLEEYIITIILECPTKSMDWYSKLIFNVLSIGISLICMNRWAAMATPPTPSTRSARTKLKCVKENFWPGRSQVSERSAIEQFFEWRTEARYAERGQMLLKFYRRIL